MGVTNGRPTPWTGDQTTYRYDDTSDLIEGSLEELARRRARWQGDDLHAITLLVSLVEATEQAIAERVTATRRNGHSWAEIAKALGTTVTEVRLEFEQSDLLSDA